MTRAPCPQSDAVLRALQAAGQPVAPRVLASRVCLRESTVASLLARLERYGLAHRTPEGWQAGRLRSEREELRERFAGGVG